MTSIEMYEAGDDRHSTSKVHVPTQLAESHPKKRCGNKLLYLVVGMCVLNLIIVILLAAFGDFRRYSSSPEVGDTSPSLSSSSGDVSAESSESSRAGSQSIAETLAGQSGNQVLHIGLRQDPSLQDCLSGGMKQTFPDIDYSFYGYNVLKGYPLADGRDPGFTRPLFAFNFSSGGHTADCRYALPKGLSAAPDVACRTSFTSKTVSNSNDLKESLNVNAKVSGGGWGVSFSASADYKEASSTISKGESKMIQSTASCKYYFSKLNRLDMPDFSSEMIVWLKRMEASLNRTNTVDDNLVYEFVDYFGTHMPITMVYGARFTYQSKVSSTSYETLSDSEYSVDVQASYSGLFSLGGGFGMSESQTNAAKNFSEETETSTLSVGAPPPYNGDAMTWASTVKDTPVPVQYELVPIYELFNEKYNVHQYFDEHRRRQIRGKILNIASSYCRKAADLGLDVQCNDDSLIKFKNVAIWAGHANETLTRELTPCIDECEKRSYCVMITWSSNNQACQLGHGDDNGTWTWNRSLNPCEHCETFFNPQGLRSPLSLIKFRYDSSVTRRNKLSVPRESITRETYIELRAFCALHCSKDENCIGFEVSDSTDFKYNCATYSHHSEYLVATELLEFETNVIGDLAKRTIKEQYSHFTHDFTISHKYFDRTPSGIEVIEKCDTLCCIRRCKDDMNCISAIYMLKDKQECNHVLDEFRGPLALNETNESSELRRAIFPESSGLRLTIFPEKASSGWFNVSGGAWDSSINVPVNNIDACADRCASNINCVCASWKSLKQLCFHITNGWDASNYESDAGSMLMYPNHIERIKRFKLTH